MKILKNIAKNNNLELIETTSQPNGYPSNISGALIGFESFAQAEELAKEYNLEISTFKKKDGWSLWYRTESTAYKPFMNSSSDYGDNYSEFSKIDEEDFIENEVKFFFENDLVSFDQIESFLKQKKEIWEQIELMEDDEIVITNDGRYFETIKKESMYFYHDTNHNVIGIQEKE